MRTSAQMRRGFTLIEMVIVLAIVGIALALVAPSLILEPRRSSLATVISDARRAALAKSETVSLSVAENGGWEMAGLQSIATIASGKGIPPGAGAFTMNISPLGVCTIDDASDQQRRTLDPFTCTFSEPAERISR